MQNFNSNRQHLLEAVRCAGVGADCSLWCNSLCQPMTHHVAATPVPVAIASYKAARKQTNVVSAGFLMPLLLAVYCSPYNNSSTHSELRHHMQLLLILEQHSSTPCTCCCAAAWPATSVAQDGCCLQAATAAAARCCYSSWRELLLLIACCGSSCCQRCCCSLTRSFSRNSS